MVQKVFLFGKYFLEGQLSEAPTLPRRGHLVVLSVTLSDFHCVYVSNSTERPHAKGYFLKAMNVSCVFVNCTDRQSQNAPAEFCLFTLLPVVPHFTFSSHYLTGRPRSSSCSSASSSPIPGVATPVHGPLPLPWPLRLPSR